VSGPRILVLFGLLLLAGAFLASPSAALLPGAILAALGAALILAASLRGGADRSRAANSSLRASFGPVLDALESVAVFTVDRDGKVGYANRGAVRVFGKPARELEGRPAGVVAYSETEDPDFAAGLREVFETGRATPARRLLLYAGGGPRLEAVVTMAPVVRYGKVVEVAVLRADTRGGAPLERHGRLLDSTPAALLGVDSAGRIDAVNRRLADLLGRREDALEGLDVDRTEALPESVRALLRTHAARAGSATPPPSVEEDLVLVTPGGASRPYTVFVSARAGGGADAVFVDGASRRRLRTELEAARQALAESREAAAEAIASTTHDLREKVARIVEAARLTADESSGPLERRAASDALKATTEQLLARAGADAADALTPEVFGDGSVRPPVLLVEDNEENRELLAHMLRSRGADVLAVGSGREAVDAAARLRFRFVLLDLQMPEMDGFQVLRRLRALPGGDRLPVVALTALTSDLVRERCEAEGMDDFVSKPVTLARVGELVAKWGRRARA
jgi:PAS domain S-box-containing protein